MSSSSPAALEYLVQVFVTFSDRPEHRPLLLRVHEDATVGAALSAALERIRSIADVDVPSSNVGNYALCHALGDGTVDPSAAGPMDHSVILRRAGLQFPFMLALLYLGGGDDAAAALPSGKMPFSAVDAASLGSALLAHEKQAAASQRAEVERRRAENLKAIEQRRAARELEHYHHSELYEIERRQATANATQIQLAAERAAEAESIHKQAMETAAVARAAEAQQREMEQHRRQMQAAIEAENTRLEEAKRRQAAQEAARETERRAEAAKKKAALDASLHERMQQTLDSLVGDLDLRVMLQRQHDEMIAQTQRQQRAEAARQARRLDEVRTQETLREGVRLQERKDRLAKEVLEQERHRITNIARAEDLALRAEAERTAFAGWKVERSVQDREREALLELEYRHKRSIHVTATTADDATVAQ